MKSKNNKTVIHLGLFSGLIFAILYVVMFCLIVTGFFMYLTFLVVGTLIVWIVWSCGHIRSALK